MILWGGVLSLVRNLVEAAFGGIVFAIPGVIVALGVIYYLNRPTVKTFFGRGSLLPTR